MCIMSVAHDTDVISYANITGQPTCLCQWPNERTKVFTGRCQFCLDHTMVAPRLNGIEKFVAVYYRGCEHRRISRMYCFSRI